MSDSDFSSGSHIAIKDDPFSITNKLNDPIIQQILQNRKIELDENITQEDEIERQKMMYIWLRNSKRYRKLQVEDANQKEKISHLDMKSIQDACNAINDAPQASTKPSDPVKAKKRVSFSVSKDRILPPKSHSDAFDNSD